MDTAMRDMERLCEREGDDGLGRKVAMLLIAALATVGLVFAMGVLLSPAATEEQEPADPLLALDQAAGLAVDPGEPETPPLAAPEVDRGSLTFPETLVEHDERPEVAAAMAALAAELQHPDPLGAAPPPAPEPAPPTRVHLPAATAAGLDSSSITRSIGRDPMVASALANEEPETPAPMGREGRYSLQVISYQDRQLAADFAQGLRARGHQAFLTHADIEGRGRFYRVRVGPFETRREAQSYRTEFEREEQMNTLVVRRADTATGNE